jgi:hypothetical protein
MVSAWKTSIPPAGSGGNRVPPAKAARNHGSSHIIPFLHDWQKIDVSNQSTPTCTMTRCTICKKKLLLCDLACAKCQNRHCTAHRLPEEHACSHDFMKEGKTLLEKQNPRVVAEKIGKI